VKYEPKKTDRELYIRIWGVPPNDPAGTDPADKSRAPRGRQKNLYRMPPLEQATESSQVTGEDVWHAESRDSVQKTAADPQIDEIRSTLNDPMGGQAMITHRLFRPPQQLEQQPVRPLHERGLRRVSRKTRRSPLILLTTLLLLAIGATFATAYLKLGSIPASSDATSALTQIFVINGSAVTWVNLMFGLGAMFVAAGIGLTLTRRRARKFR
jgi:hypothetical protein